MEQLNDPQAKAVSTVKGPLLIVAGAGSGKTRVITFRIAEMLAQGIPERSILALTFTNKAAKEMKHRVRGVVGSELKNLVVSTFHAFGVTVIRDYVGRLGYAPRFSIYDQVDKIALLKEVARETGTDLSAGAVYDVAGIFSEIKTRCTQWTDETSRYRPLLDEYRDHLKAYNAVDFDDLIMLPIELMEQDESVRNELRSRYEYVLVDEFQDTSIAQYQMVKLLAEGHRNLCVVGDDDQSIYSRRGANYRNMELFEKDFPERAQIMLEQNYRSTKEILSAANSVISNNTERKPKQLWTGLEGERSIEIAYPEDEIKEARFITRMIRTEALQRRLGYDEFCILVRANSLMALIEDGLVSDNIPYRISGGSSFFERKEIRDLIAYLRVFGNPNDDVSLLRVINTPRRGIGRRSLEAIRVVATQQRCSFYTAVEAATHAADSPLSERVREHLESFTGIVADFGERAKKGKIAVAVKELTDELDYWGHLLQQNPEREEIAKYKYRNVRTFIDMIEAWERDPDNVDTSLYAFLQRIALISREDVDEEAARGRVNLMTIHAAKGLEFSVVFLAGVEDHLIPHARSVEESDGNLQEERRLFYVAITRAKTKLYMTSCARRRVMRQVMESQPSRFLSEIPKELLFVHDNESPVDSADAGGLFAEIKARLR